MDVEPRSPLEHGLHWESPAERYHVVFWRQPRAPQDVLARGIPQEQIMWSASEWDVVEPADLHEVIAWADTEARRRRSIYTLSIVMTDANGEEGLIRLAGHDPSVTADWNYERRWPPDVDPVH